MRIVLQLHTGGVIIDAGTDVEVVPPTILPLKSYDQLHHTTKKNKDEHTRGDDIRRSTAQISERFRNVKTTTTTTTATI